MSGPSCSLVTGGSVPRVVEQALDDRALPPMARLMMWHLRHRLDFMEFREVKAASLAADMRIKESTVGQMLTMLVERGYLEESGKKKPRAFRMPWSRRTTQARSA